MYGLLYFKYKIEVNKNLGIDYVYLDSVFILGFCCLFIFEGENVRIEMFYLI